MAENRAIEKIFDNSVDVVKKILKEKGVDILKNPMGFSNAFSAIAPNLSKDNNIFTMALNMGIGQYFINVPDDKHNENVEKVRTELGSFFNEDAIDTVIEGICQAVGWNEIVTTKSNPEKLVDIAENYYFGQNGFTQDYEKAVKFATLAAEKGVRYGQFRLAYCYKNGQGVEKDYKKAVEWYEKSAEQGHSVAQYNLAICYENGQGVEKDYKKAVEWYEKSAAQGYSFAQNNLAVCYRNGQGVEKDLFKAICLYVKSYENGNKTAEENLRKLIAKIK